MAIFDLSVEKSNVSCAVIVNVSRETFRGENCIMAKRRKRKHRPSASYLKLADKLQSKSIIPTITPKARISKIESKQIRDSIRRAYSEQRKVTIDTPKSVYKGSKKKNRKEARQKRKEKKQKAKQLQQQRQIQQQSEEPENIPTPDYGERDEDFRSETADIDDTEDYLDQLIAKVNYVNEGLQEKYGHWYGYKGTMFSDLDTLLYYLEDATQFPYEIKKAICDTLEANSYLEEVNKVLAYEHYKEVEESLDALASEITSIIESAY